MIERRLLEDHFDDTAAALERKGVAREDLYPLRDLLMRRKGLAGKVSDYRGELNAASKEIGQLFRSGQRDAAEAAKEKVREIKGHLEAIEVEQGAVEAEVHERMLQVPNLPHTDAPDGKGEDDNVVLRYGGPTPESFEGKGIRPHWDIMEEFDLLDAERGAKLSGSMFTMLKGYGAKVLRALVRFGLDINEDLYTEIVPPHFVTTETFTGTGHLPKFADDAYHIESDGLWAIPTGEVPLTGMHRDEILNEEDLPRGYMAYTVCFRREAGSAGRDTRGLQRLHEFHKVELVRLCRPEDVPAQFEQLVADAEQPLKLLGLPYRVLDLCAGDLTFGSQRVYDLEVYAPGAERWLEVSSCGIFGDFQARRSNIRFRRAAGGKPEFACLLNGSGIATPRVIAALFEVGQQPDGSIRMPDALIPYCGFHFIPPLDKG